jgi:hypothetical protein
MARSQRPFVLPDEPVDQYEVRWWRVGSNQDLPVVREVRAVYHVNTSWQDLFGKSDGSPFINQWSFQVDGRFDGRGGAWNDWTWNDWGCEYPSREAAVEHARKIASQRLADLERRAAAVRKWLEDTK